MTAPLQGIRVIECANWLAAPSGAALLADLGADVIKVEPPTGDPFRAFQLSWQRPDLAYNPTFQMDNRGKRSVTVDLTHAGGPGLLRDLLKSAHVFMTNLLPQRQARYGLDYDALKAAFPGLVYVSVSGFGAEGPDMNRPGFDYSAFWARSGLMGLMGEPGSPPPVQRPGMGDHTTAINVMTATLAALRRRDQTGEGLHVDVSLLATGMWVLGSDLSSAAVAKKIPPRYSRERPFNPIWNAYMTKDKHWLLLVMPHPDPYWPQFCRAVGHPEWIDDPRYDTRAKRHERNTEMVGLLDEVFAGRDLAEWRQHLNSEGLIWSNVMELPQVLDDAQAHTMGHFATVPHDTLGELRTLNTPFRILGAEIGPKSGAPEIGQHTEEVLLEAGFDWDRIAQLRESGVLG